MAKDKKEEGQEKPGPKEEAVKAFDCKRCGAEKVIPMMRNNVKCCPMCFAPVAWSH